MRKILIALISIAVVGLFYFFLFKPSANQVINLALKKNGKTYVFSKQGQQITQMEIDQGKSPGIFPFMQILISKKELYVIPSLMQELCSVLAGNYNLHEYKEPAFEGYFTVANNKNFELSTENRTTDKVGEQLLVYNVKLTNKVGETKDIVWSQVPMSTEITAIDNCELKSFMVITKPHPGESVGSSKQFIVVKIQDLLDFYKSDFKFEYNKKEQLLYLIEG